MLCRKWGVSKEGAMTKEISHIVGESMIALLVIVYLVAMIRDLGRGALLVVIVVGLIASWTFLALGLIVR
jgi:hypothetical protein